MDSKHKVFIGILLLATLIIGQAIPVFAVCSPHVSSPHVSVSPHVSSPHVSSPHPSSPHVSAPHESSPHVSTPKASTPEPAPKSNTPNEEPSTTPSSTTNGVHAGWFPWIHNSTSNSLRNSESSGGTIDRPTAKKCLIVVFCVLGIIGLVALLTLTMCAM